MERSRRRRKKFILLLTAAGIVCTAVFAYVTVRLYEKRKETEAMIGARKYVQSEESHRFQSKTIEYQGKTYRRNSYVKAILCMGVDRKGSMLDTTTYTFGGQADGIFVIAQDTTRNTIKILVVSRDSMTEITMTDLSGNVLGTDIQHLTLAYAYGDGSYWNRSRCCRGRRSSWCSRRRRSECSRLGSGIQVYQIPERSGTEVTEILRESGTKRCRIQSAADGKASLPPSGHGPGNKVRHSCLIKGMVTGGYEKKKY